MSVFRTLIAACALAAPVAAHAATITPVFADCDPGVPSWNGSGVACGATDAGAVNLGAPDNAAYSLGLPTVGITGVAVFRFDTALTGQIWLYDKDDGANAEAADVFLGHADAFGDFDSTSVVYVGTVTNGYGGSPAVTMLSFAGSYEFLYIQDASLVQYPVTGSTDGYDLDSIRLAAVPLAPSGLMLGGALLGLASRRRKRG